MQIKILYTESFWMHLLSIYNVLRVIENAGDAVSKKLTFILKGLAYGLVERCWLYIKAAVIDIWTRIKQNRGDISIVQYVE